MKAPVNTDNWSGSIKSDKAPLNTDDWNGFISPELANDLSSNLAVKPSIFRPPVPNKDSKYQMQVLKKAEEMELEQLTKSREGFSLPYFGKYSGYLYIGVVALGGYLLYRKFKK